MTHAIEQRSLGSVDGVAVTGYRLIGGQTQIEVMTFGAILARVMRPDNRGRLDDIVLGYDDPADYGSRPGNAGAVCGRHAGRLAAGRFTLDGATYHLPLNNGVNHIHGGVSHFGKRHWEAEPNANENSVTFSLHSPDGDQGYPGTLDARVTYRLDDEGSLHIAMRADSERTTIVNLVHHGYWNLAGHRSGDVGEQWLRIAASAYTPLTTDKLPTGGITPVEGTPFDFTSYKPIGRDIAKASPGGGYDHNFCLDGHDGSMQLACEAFDSASGRSMKLFTNQPGLQLYTANHCVDAPVAGKEGALYLGHAGFALETQNYPNAPNIAAFPSAVLRPGERYQHDMTVSFATMR